MLCCRAGVHISHIECEMHHLDLVIYGSRLQHVDSQFFSKLVDTLVRGVLGCIALCFVLTVMSLSCCTSLTDTKYVEDALSVSGASVAAGTSSAAGIKPGTLDIPQLDIFLQLALGL